MDYINDPHKAELFAAEALKRWGYVDAVATTGGADGGIDVRAHHALAQVKFKGSVAGRPELQNLYGARAGETDKTLFFFSGAGYSSQAVEYAKKVGMNLFVFDVAGNLTQINGTVRPTVRGRSWVSPDWIALWHVMRAAVRLLTPTASNKTYRKSRPRRHA